jgi:hypothetical protein
MWDAATGAPTVTLEGQLRGGGTQGIYSEYSLFVVSHPNLTSLSLYYFNIYQHFTSVPCDVIFEFDPMQ